jgi:alkanesulfonate monooxygenase SsuD/methylene tetrahydromethanopterin reductase-like flavin-dependent oxidoreductase (luciferase family)
MTDRTQVSFGIKTTPVHTTYGEILRVWKEADAIPEIEHAWLWDHMLPLFGPVDGPIYEGWTLLAALAARTERLRVGLMVTSNAVRPPAVLAKIAATTDVVSDGRLDFGIGVGGTHQPGDEFVPREYGAYGLDIRSPAEGIGRLEESLQIIKRLWTGDQFDFEGEHYTLRGAVGQPQPVQKPHPPILIGGWGDRTLRVVAEHADIWNVPGPPHNTVEWVGERSRVLDEQCKAVGRDPHSIARSAQVIVTYEDPASARASIVELVRLGVTHIVVNLYMPFPDGVAKWVVDEIIDPVRSEVLVG